MTGESIYNFTIPDTDGNGVVDGDEDYDADGLINRIELSLLRWDGVPFYNPLRADTNNNGVLDADEDYDGDSLTNRQELALLGSNDQPVYNFTKADTDANGIHDGNEDYDGDGLRNRHELRLLVVSGEPIYDFSIADTDDNGVLDGDEDYDADGLVNRIEVFLLRSNGQPFYNPLLADTDNNGVLDGSEDYDGDGLTNIQELMLLDSMGQPVYEFTVADTDGNGVSDIDEDYDGDGLTNRQELTLLDDNDQPVYDFTAADTDGDGISDIDEDYDGDGLTNRQELLLLDDNDQPVYDFTVTDTDGDGVSDGDGLTNVQELTAVDGAGQSVYDLTVADTDGNGVLDGDEDYDGDCLTNLQELLLLDAKGAVIYSFTVADTEGNGVLDGDEDPDEDGLTNAEEFSILTGLFNPDTDGDRLPDGFEVRVSLTAPTVADSDGNGTTDDHEDPDGDGLNNYQEYRLGTDPYTPDVLGAPSRLGSETIAMPDTAVADGISAAEIITVVRDAQGRFLPNHPVSWRTASAHAVITLSDSVTDEEGVARASVTSAVVTSAVIEVLASDIVVGRPVLRFVGGDPAVHFIANSPQGVLPGQVINTVFEVRNEGALPISNIDVVANIPFGIGTILMAEGASDVTAQSVGLNSALWKIPALDVGETRVFHVRLRVGYSLRRGSQIPLSVQITAYEDTNAVNNSAVFSGVVVPDLVFTTEEAQSEKLSVSFMADVAEAAIGQTVELVVVVENLSDEPLFNITGAMPLLGTQYPNVVFSWHDPMQPGYVAPAGNGAASQAVARIAYMIPELYPANLDRSLMIRAVDSDPADGASLIFVRDSLTDDELGIRGPVLTTRVLVDRPAATVGETVTFTLNISNSSAASDAAAGLEIASNLLASPAPINTLQPGESTSIQFPYVVTNADVPQLTAQFSLTGHGLNDEDVLLQYTVRRVIRIYRGTPVPGAGNLTIQSASVPAFLPGRDTPLTVNVANSGGLPLNDAQLRVVIPFGVEPNLASLNGGTYDAARREVVWVLGALAPEAVQTVTAHFTTSAELFVGMELIFDVLLATTSDEADFEDNMTSVAGRVETPAPSTVTIVPVPRDWVVADGADLLILEVRVYDQLGAPLSGLEAAMSASLSGITFEPITPISGAEGLAQTVVRATEAGTVDVMATFENRVYGELTLNRRVSAVTITRSPEPIGVGGMDSYDLFVVNTATLPDGLTATADIIDLAVELPPELPADWFTFPQTALPLGFGQFTNAQLNVAIPSMAELPNCEAIIGTYPITVTATGRTLGLVGQTSGQLVITAEPPTVSHIMPDIAARAGGERILFGWRSNTPGDATVYTRRQGESVYTPLTLSADVLDTQLYSGILNLGADAEGTVYEWYGEMSNGCGTRVIANDGQPYTFTRVRSTTFADAGYDFTIADEYDQTLTTDGQSLTIRVRNDDTVSHAIVLDVENPYSDLTLGFIATGSVDQVAMLAPGQVFTTVLRVFPQDTTREMYPLTLRLENDAGEIDRIPLVLRIKQPRIELDVEILEVDPRTLVTYARLTNVGDTLTDLSLEIVQDSTGIPANMIIQPDVQHTYLRAGQTLDVAFIPLDLQGNEPEGFEMMSAWDNSAPSLMSVSGPFRVSATARGMEVPDLALRGGDLSNTCGANGSERTVAAPCRMPAGSETRTSSGWYCTNRPDIDLMMSFPLPNNGFGVPVTSVSVATNFTPSSNAYNHSTTVAFNGAMVGSAMVPGQRMIRGNVPVSSLLIGDMAASQLITLRSKHSNETHYTVASGFRVTVEYDEHMRNGCFTPQEVATYGDELMCEGAMDGPLYNGGGSGGGDDVDVQSIDLTLTVDKSKLAPERRSNPNTFTVGEQIPLLAEVRSTGTINITDTVRIELTVPRELRPVGMTIQGENQFVLNLIFTILRNFLDGIIPGLGEALAEQVLGIDASDTHVTFAYDYEGALVVGQPFPIMLDVVGDVAGEFTIVGVASLQPYRSDFAERIMSDQAGLFSTSYVTFYYNNKEANFTNLDLTIGGEHQAGRAGIFWAIWNETSDDRQYSGHDAEIISADLTSEEIEQRFRDDQARKASSFLADDPYCDNGQNLAGDEPPNNPDGWASNIRSFNHCDDHRYFDANVILNGFLSYERRATYEPTSTNLTFGAIYGYLATNFRGTFNDSAVARSLWADIPQCRAYLSPYPATLISTNNEQQYTYENFDDLLKQIGRLYALTSERQQKLQERNNVGENNPRYAELTNDIDTLTSNIRQLPALYQIQGLAMLWISGYLECLNANNVSTVSIKHSRVEAQLNRAINNLYQEGNDPTNGAFNRRNPNRQGESLVLPISEAVDFVDRATANLYYSNG